MPGVCGSGACALALRWMQQARKLSLFYSARCLVLPQLQLGRVLGAGSVRGEDAHQHHHLAFPGCEELRCQELTPIPPKGPQCLISVLSACWAQVCSRSPACSLHGVLSAELKAKLQPVLASPAHACAGAGPWAGARHLDSVAASRHWVEWVAPFPADTQGFLELFFQALANLEAGDGTQGLLQQRQRQKKLLGVFADRPSPRCCTRGRLCRRRSEAGAAAATCAHRALQEALSPGRALCSPCRLHRRGEASVCPRFIFSCYHRFFC